MKRKTLVLIALIVGLAGVGALFLTLRQTGGGSGTSNAGSLKGIPSGGSDSDRAGSPAGRSGTPSLSAGSGSGSGEAAALERLEEWLSLAGMDDGMRRNAAGQELSELLRLSPGGMEEVYRRLRGVLEDPSVTDETKRALLHLLERVATPAAARLFIDLSSQDLPEGLRQSVNNAVSSIGEYFWDKASAAETSPMLLEAWSQARDPQLLRALAQAIAKVGDPAGVNQLMDSVFGQGGDLAEIRAGANPRASAALSALEGPASPEVISMMGGRLSVAAGSKSETAVVARLLAATGRIEATQALLSWAQRCGDGNVPLIREVFGRIQNGDSILLLSSALAQNTAFKSELVRQTIASAVKGRRL